MYALGRAIGLLAALGLLAACGADVVRIEVTESGQAGGMALSFPGMESFGSSLGRALGDEDVKPGDVDSMRVERVELALLSQGGLTEDLGFLQQVRFLVAADGMEAEVLAERASIPEGARTIEFEVTPELDLKPFLKAGGMRIEIDAELAFPPPDVVELEATFKIRVDVNVV